VGLTRRCTRAWTIDGHDRRSDRRQPRDYVIDRLPLPYTDETSIVDEGDIERLPLAAHIDPHTARHRPIMTIRPTCPYQSACGRWADERTNGTTHRLGGRPMATPLLLSATTSIPQGSHLRDSCGS
jgi:hypothetical protein